MLKKVVRVTREEFETASVAERKRKMNRLEEDKQSLIELIEWYRDEYHKSDFCHTEMIEKIK
jgi:hypothetical protein